MPRALPTALSGLALITVAVVASILPAARAARVDVMQAWIPTLVNCLNTTEHFGRLAEGKLQTFVAQPRYTRMFLVQASGHQQRIVGTLLKANFDF